MRRFVPALVALVLACAAPARPEAAGAAAAEVKYPRYASLRAGKVNVRTGPGRRYPIAWVFVRQGLPVQVIGAFEAWRRIRDWEGTEGWVHQSLLSRRASVILLKGPEGLYRRASREAPLVARIERRAIGRPIACEGAWCRVEFAGLRGWIDRASIWGVEETPR